MIDVNTSPRLRLDPDGTLHISQTWSGDIGTYTCRVTSVGGNDSRSAHLRVRSAHFTYAPTRLILTSVFFFPSPFHISVCEGVKDGWFLHCCGFMTALLSNRSNTSNIYNARLPVCLFNSVVWHLPSLDCLFPALMQTLTCTHRQLPHAPENPVAVLSNTEKRGINLTWAQAFDGNSPLIRYLLEVSENSELITITSDETCFPVFLIVILKPSCFCFHSTDALICRCLYYITTILFQKLAVASFHVFCNQSNSIASLVRFLMNDQGNRIEFTSNALIFFTR